MEFIDSLDSVCVILILPCVSFIKWEHAYIFRHGLRLRGKNQREAGDNSPAEAEEKEEDKQAEEGEEEKETETENKEEEKNEGGEDEEDTDDCEVCPGTEVSQFLTFVVFLTAILAFLAPFTCLKTSTQFYCLWLEA